MNWKVKAISVTLVSQTVTLPNSSPLAFDKQRLLTFILWNKGEGSPRLTLHTAEWAAHGSPLGVPSTMRVYSLVAIVYLPLMSPRTMSHSKPLKKTLYINVHHTLWMGQAFREAESHARERKLTGSEALACESGLASVSRSILGLRQRKCPRARRRRGFQTLVGGWQGSHYRKAGSTRTGQRGWPWMRAGC